VQFYVEGMRALFDLHLHLGRIVHERFRNVLDQVFYIHNRDLSPDKIVGQFGKLPSAALTFVVGDSSPQGKAPFVVGDSSPQGKAPFVVGDSSPQGEACSKRIYAHLDCPRPATNVHP
jgi:hypothetical protein